MSNNPITRIKMRISRLTDHKDLEDLKKYIYKRSRLLSERSHGKAVVKKWAEVKTWRQLRDYKDTNGHYPGAWDGLIEDIPAERVWCNAPGMFVGGKYQRGSAFVVYHIQPRKMRVWLIPLTKQIHYKNAFWASPGWLVRYAIKAERPDNPLPKEEAEMLEKIGEMR